MKKIIVFLLAVSILVVCLASCGETKAIKNKLCGPEWTFSWEEALFEETYIFNSDGTYKAIIYSGLAGMEVEHTGKYTISEEKIELVRDSDSYESELDYIFEKGTLTLTNRNKSISK